MRLEKVTKKDVIRDKPKGRYLRLFPSKGSIFFSSGLCEHLILKDKDHFMIFWIREKNLITRVFVAKENDTEVGFKLGKHSDSGNLQSYSANLVKELLDFFGIDPEEKSTKLGIKPEPINYKEFHGYVMYELVKL